MDPVAFFALFLGQEAGQLACLVFQAPHQVAVLRVAWLVHQTNGHGDVVPSFVAAGFSVQSSDVGGFAGEFRIAHNQLADRVQSVVEAGVDVAHFPFSHRISSDVEMHRDVHVHVRRQFREILGGPVWRSVAKGEVDRLGCGQRGDGPREVRWTLFEQPLNARC